MRITKYLYPLVVFLALGLMYIAPLYISLSLRNFIFAFIIALCGSISFIYLKSKTNHLSKWIIVPVITAFFLSFSMPLVKDSYPDIKVIATGQKNSLSKSSEVFVQFKTTDASGLKIAALGWEKRDDVYVSYHNQPNAITFKGSWGSESYLNFVSHPFSGIATLQIGNETRNIDLYSAVGHSVAIPLPEGSVSWKSWMQRLSILISIALTLIFLLSKDKYHHSVTVKLASICLMVASSSLWYVKDISYTGDLELVVISGNGTPDKMSFDAGHGFTDTLTFPLDTGQVHTVTIKDSVNGPWNIDVINGSASRYKPESSSGRIDDYCDLTIKNTGCLYEIVGDNPVVFITNGSIRQKLDELVPSKSSLKYFVYLANDDDNLTATSTRAVIYTSTWQHFSQWIKAVAVSNNSNNFKVLARISALKPGTYTLLADNTNKGEVSLSSFNYQDTTSFIAMKVAFSLICSSFVILFYLLFKIFNSLRNSYRNQSKSKIVLAVTMITGWLLLALVIGWPAVLGWDGFAPYIMAQGGQITLWYGIGYPLMVGGFLLSNFPELVTLWSFFATLIFLLGTISLFFRFYEHKIALFGVIWVTIYIPLSLIMFGMLTHLRDAMNGMILSIFMLGGFCVAFFWKKISIQGRIFYCGILVLLGLILALMRIDNIPSLIIIAAGLLLMTRKFNIRMLAILIPVILAWCAINKIVEPLIFPDRVQAAEQKRLYASTAVMNPLTGMLVYGKDKLDPILYHEISDSLNQIMDIDYALKNWSPYNVVYWHQTASQRPLPSTEVSTKLTKLYFKSMLQEPLLFLHLRLSTFTAILGQDFFPLPPLPSPQFGLSSPALTDHLLATTNPWKQTVEVMGFGPHPHFSTQLMQKFLSWSDLVANSLLQLLICLVAIGLFRYNPFSAVVALAIVVRCVVFFFFAPASVYLYLYELQLMGFAMPVMMLVEWKMRRNKEVRNDS